MLSIFRKIHKSEFANHVGLLAFSGFVAQIIGIISLPILTRMYHPDAFATLALFMAFISVMSPIACGRYDLAVILSENDEKSTDLLLLSVWVATLICTFLFIVFIFFENALKDFFNAKNLEWIWFLIPITVYFSAITSSFQYLANRNKQYLYLCKIKILQATCYVLISIVLFFITFKTEGLVLASILAIIFNTLAMICGARVEMARLIRAPCKKLWKVAKEYKSYPLLNAGTTFLDSLTLMLPVFFIAKYYSETMVGYYALLVRVATAPLGILVQSIGQVYLRKVSDRVRSEQSLSKDLYKLFGLLIFIVIPPSMLLIFYAPELFEYMFGSEWRPSGELLVILMPALAIRLMVSPLSGVMVGSGNNHLLAFWQFIAFISTFVSLSFFSGKIEIEQLFFVMSIVDLALYSLYLFFIFYSAWLFNQTRLNRQKTLES